LTFNMDLGFLAFQFSVLILLFRSRQSGRRLVSGLT
jgi:hypothetical protein